MTECAPDDLRFGALLLRAAGRRLCVVRPQTARAAADPALPLSDRLFSGHVAALRMRGRGVVRRAQSRGHVSAAVEAEHQLCLDFPRLSDRHAVDSAAAAFGAGRARRPGIHRSAGGLVRLAGPADGVAQTAASRISGR